jgi:hypothetical protein
MNDYIMNKCMSVKNKRSKEQCNNKRKGDSEYCGIHNRQLKIIRIDQISININCINQNNSINVVSYMDNIKPYTVKQIFNLNQHNNRILLKTAELYNIDKYYDQSINQNSNISILSITGKVSIVNSDQSLLFNIQQSIIRKIIKIQSIIRGRKIRKIFGKGLLQRQICVNDEDFYTFEHKNDIPTEYFFSYVDQSIVYCFDIRSFIILLSKNCINPYTRSDIPENVKQYVQMRKRYMQRLNIPFEIDIDILTDEQQLRDNMITVFNKYDLLGHYTNHEWILNLSMRNLKKLYIGAEDIWNYRASLTNIQKSRIVSSIPFQISPTIVSEFTNANKKKLIEIIMYEFNRFITEGIDETERKLGALLMLTALVEVSPETAISYPHLIQETF